MVDLNNESVEIDNADNIISSDDEFIDDSNEPQTWYVNPDPDNPNQVQAPTVQPIINQAKSGDTIILNGTFLHCHFTINKTLTIKSTPDTILGVCPHHNHPLNSSTFGVFYITPDANGSVIDGFTFTNDFFSAAKVQQNPFAVFINGASDIQLKNLVINWTGIKVNELNPEDYRFNAVIIKNSKNITLTNLFINNTENSLSIENTSDVLIENSTIIEVKFQNDSSNSSGDVQKTLINTSLIVSNLNIKVGDGGNLNITLHDGNNKGIYNKNISVLVDGVVKSVTSDLYGISKLDVKYNVAGTYYVFVSFSGDDIYKSSINVVKIVVSKKSANLIASKKTFKVKSTKNIKVTLKSGSSFIKNKKITLKVKGKTYSAKTNAKGIANIKIKLNKKGIFKYTVKFGGDNVYNAVYKSSTIVIRK